METIHCVSYSIIMFVDHEENLILLRVRKNDYQKTI